MSRKPRKTPFALTPAKIVKAEDLVRQGLQTPGLEWREAGGFSIRFSTRGGTYRLRTETATPKLGEVGITPGHVARHLAHECRQALRSGRDHNAYVRVYTERFEAGDGHDAAHIEALRVSSGKSGAISSDAIWTVAELSKSFVDYKVKNVFKDGRWATRFPRLFDDPVFDPIRNKKVCDVGHADLFAIRRALVPTGEKGGSRAVVLVRYMVGMFDHGLANEADVCGLLGRDPIWRAVTVEAENNPRRRAPEPVELARTLLIVKQHAAREDGVVVASLTLQTLLLFVFSTAQRTGAAAKLRRENLLAYPGRADWRIAHFPGAQMKGLKGKTLAHAVPVAPSMVRAIEHMWAEVDPQSKSQFVFPGHRGAGPRAAAGLNGLFRQLRGDADDRRPAPKTYYEGKPGPKPRPPRKRKPIDLLETYLRELKSHPDEQTDFTPHDARRGFTNFLSERGLGGAASAVLAHAQGDNHKQFVEESAEEQMARTTSRHYFTSQRIELKTKGVELWTAALDEALVAEADRVQEIGRAIA
ncbi:hypothetical protein ACFOWB_25325 [Chenggangzhangella methanolivorans]